MTHILINESREIRYMAYVPEEPHFSAWEYMSPATSMKCYKVKQAYSDDLEKAKRESLPFDREEDREKITMAIFNYMAEQDNMSTNLSPGIYQVPVEVEVVSVTDCKMQYGFPPAVCGSVNNCDCPVKQFARLKSSEPKEESQEEIVQAFFIEYNRLMQGGRPQHSVALKLLDKFSLTRKRG